MVPRATALALVCAASLACGRTDLEGWPASLTPGDGRSDSGDTYDPPPTVAITAPNSGRNLTVYEPTVLVSGTCSTDVVSLTTSLGTFVDDDCSDETWALADYTMDYPPRRHTFTVTAEDAGGSQVSDEIAVTYAYVRLEDNRSPVYRAVNPAIINGNCSAEVTSITLNEGVLVDADCSDRTFSVEMTFSSGEGSYLLTATAYDALTRSEHDDIDVIYDITPPDPPNLTGTEPPSPNDECFPVVLGESEERSSVELFADASCTVTLSPPSPYWTNGLRIPVPPGSTTEVFAQATDLAGNRSACSSSPITYQNTRSRALPSCDITVSQDETFADFQARLDAAELNRADHLADGIVAICLAENVTIATSSSAQGDRLEIPGDDFYLLAPSGTATLHNARTDAQPSVYEARGVVYLEGHERFAMANLNLQADGDTSRGLHAINASIVMLSGLDVSVSTNGGVAVLFERQEFPVWLAEMNASTLLGSTALGVRMSRIRLIDSSTFSYHGDSGIHLDNAHILITEIRDSLISSDDPSDGGAGLRFHSANRNATLQKMSGTTIRRGAAATSDSGYAVLFLLYPNDQTYVRTPNIVDNVFCQVGANGWATLLDNGDRPTIPYDPNDNAATNGYDSFPWGDASHAAVNPGYNQQAQWGGVCP